MNRLLALGLVVALASGAYAGGNPDVRIYIDFDPTDYVHSIEPLIYTMFDAYVCLDTVVGGVACVSFAMNDPVASCPGVVAAAVWYSYVFSP